MLLIPIAIPRHILAQLRDTVLLFNHVCRYASTSGRGTTVGAFAPLLSGSHMTCHRRCNDQSHERVLRVRQTLAERCGYLFLDVCGLRIPHCQGILCGLAGHRLELGIAEGEAQEREWEAIDEEDGCNVCPWQQLEEGAKAVGQQEDPNRREDGSKGDLQVKSCW